MTAAEPAASNGRLRFSAIIPIHPERQDCLARQALAEVGTSGAELEVLLAKGSQPSVQRNRAAAQAAGDVLLFLDDDSVAPPALLARLARHFADASIVAVGGPSVAPPPRGRFEAATGTVLASRFGTYRIKARYSRAGRIREARETDIILCNLAMRRDFFLATGGFDERLYPNEENELFRRIRQQQPTARIVYDPEAAIVRMPPDSLGAYARKIFNYGRGRMLQTIVRPDWRSAIFLMPLLLLLYLPAAILLAGLGRWWGLLPAGAYLTCDAVFSTWHAVRTRSAVLFVILLGLFPLTHLAYAGGMLVECLQRLRQPASVRHTDVHVVVCDPSSGRTAS